MIYIKVCWWLDSNCRSLVLEATALPTEPPPLSIIFLFGPWNHNFFSKLANANYENIYARLEAKQIGLNYKKLLVQTDCVLQITYKIYIGIYYPISYGKLIFTVLSLGTAIQFHKQLSTEMS